MIAINFCFLVDFIRPTGPMVTMVTRYIGGLSQVLLVKMSWEKDSNKKSMIESNFYFLVDLTLGSVNFRFALDTLGPPTTKKPVEDVFISRNEMII